MTARLAVLALAGALSTGCVSVYAHSLSDGASAAGEPVESRDEGVGLFQLFAPDLEVRGDLARKCPSGRLSSVETVGWKRDWFGVVQVYDLRARATCNP